MSHILDIIIKATDQASATTRKVEQSMKQLGKSTQSANKVGVQSWQQLSHAQQQSLTNLSSQGASTMDRFKGAVMRTSLKVKQTWRNMSSEMKAAIGAGLTMAGMYVTNFLKESITAAKEAEKGWIAYKNALQVVSGTTVTNVDKMKQVVVDLANTTGRATGDVRTAMTSFMNKGLSYAESQKAVYAASGIAAAGLAQDTASASTMIIQALNGRGMALKKLGLDINDYKDKVTGQIDTERLLADITNKTKGAQEEYANSAEGVANRLDNSIGALKTSIGSVALQVLEPLAQVLAQVVGAFNTLPGPIKIITAGGLMLFSAFAMIAGPLLSVIELLKIFGATSAATAAKELLLTAVERGRAVVTAMVEAAQWALNAAMDANPIGIIIIAVMALVAALMYLYNNNETVRAAVDALSAALGDGLGGALEWLQGAINNVISFFQNLWNTLTQGPTKASEMVTGILVFIATLPIQIPIYLAQVYLKILDAILKWVTGGKVGAKQFVTGIINTIKNLPGKVWNYLKQVVSKITSAGGQWKSNALSAARGIVTAVGNGLSGLADSVFGKFNAVASAINRAKDSAVSAAANFASSMMSKFKALINSASPSDFYKIPANDFANIAGAVRAAKPDAVRAVGEFSRGIMGAYYDSQGFNLNTDLASTTRVVIDNKVSLNHDFSNLPAGVSAQEVANIVLSSAENDEFTRRIAESNSFQNWDYRVKKSLEFKSRRNLGV